MVIRELINKSVYGTIGYIDSQESINKVEQYILYNLPVLSQFNNIIVAANYSEEKWYIPYYRLWKKYFPDHINIISSENRGHNHGYADLDNLLVDYCKENSIEWLCKSANDVIIQESFLDKQIGEADFYYFNGIGFGGMVKYDFDNERIINEDFYPQTNFYFINVSKIDYLNNTEYLDSTYETIQSIPDYNGRIWEYFQGWSCEDFLKDCINRNNLLKEHLISKQSYISLLNLVKSNNIHDSSHKNIVIEGVCHYHNLNQGVYTI